jgi:hypothetical protein
MEGCWSQRLYSETKQAQVEATTQGIDPTEDQKVHTLAKQQSIELTRKNALISVAMGASGASSSW